MLMWKDKVNLIQTVADLKTKSNADLETMCNLI